MADKKITELTELSTPTQNDLLVIVDDPSGTPITKKIPLKTIFNDINFITEGTTTLAATSLVRSTLTANTNANTSTANTLISGEFITNATSSSANSEYQYALVAKSILNGTTANVTKEHVAAKIILDVSNAAALITNTYVTYLQVANTGTRTANVEAFIAFGDKAANSSTAQTKYLFDIGANGTANVSFAAVNTTTSVMVKTANAAAGTANAAPTHKIRVKINGSDYWLFAANNSN